MKIRVSSKSAISGEIDEAFEVGDPLACIPWDLPLIEAFLADDDIQEMTIVSTNIGFVKTLTKASKDTKDAAGDQ